MLLARIVPLAVAVALLVGAAASPAAGAAGALDPPVAPLVAERLFDPPARPWLAGHRGVDLVASHGATVRAPADGVVTFAGRVVDRGVVVIDHGRLVSSFEPVDTTVARGSAVARGDPVGRVGAEPGHCAPRACLHWGVRESGVYRDPLDVLAGFGPVRLVPVVSRRRRCAAARRGACAPRRSGSGTPGTR